MSHHRAPVRTFDFRQSAPIVERFPTSDPPSGRFPQPPSPRVLLGGLVALVAILALFAALSGGGSDTRPSAAKSASDRERCERVGYTSNGFVKVNCYLPFDGGGFMRLTLDRNVARDLAPKISGDLPSYLR